MIQNAYDPPGLNRYAFERDNPYRYTDSDGHVIPPVLIGIYVAGVTVISATSGVIGAAY